MKKREYRIVRDAYCGFEVQDRSWWFPFWTMTGGCNTFSTVAKAREFAASHAASYVVEYLGELPRQVAPKAGAR